MSAILPLVLSISIFAFSACNMLSVGLGYTARQILAPRRLHAVRRAVVGSRGTRECGPDRDEPHRDVDRAPGDRSVHVRWPARVPAGKRTNRLAMGMDWTPTFLAAAGASAHRDYPLDGIDLFGPEVQRNLYWRMVYRNQKAVRSGAWKYLSVDGAEFLYDLSHDERERANMRYREPDRFKALRAAYFEWEASMPLVPEDAKYELVYHDDTMARSSG